MLNGIQDALLIHNPAAGRRGRRRARDLEAACRIFANAGVRAELAATTRAGEATLLARDAVRSRRGLVIGCGGDGTINEIVNGLARSPVPLAILPAGTANVLGKELGLPWNIPRAARRIVAGRLERIALGLAHVDLPDGPERYFISIGGAGVDGSMVYRVDAQLKQATGTLAYWLAGLQHFFTYPLTRFRVTAAGRSFDAAQVVVGRTKHYGGPFQLTPGADLHSDRFQTAVFTATSRFRYPAYMIAVWLSRLERQGDVHFVDAYEVLCEPEPGSTIYVELDGEPGGRLPAQFRIVPDALTLVMPENETRQASEGVH